MEVGKNNGSNYIPHVTDMAMGCSPVQLKKEKKDMVHTDDTLIWCICFTIQIYCNLRSLA